MYMPAGWHANTVPPPLHTRPPSSGGGFKKNGRIAGKGSETPGVSGPCPYSTVLYKHTKIQEACESHSRNLTGEVQDQGV